LYGVENDRGVFIGVAAALAAVALAAIWSAAQRAGRIDALTSLRHE
jgi:hypothetical protein